MQDNNNFGQGGNNANTSLQTMYQVGLRIAQNVCSVLTTPVEFALRPFYGTRYFDPIQLLLTWCVMGLLPLAGTAASYVPGSGSIFAHGLIGLGTLSSLFFASHFIHGPRLWRRIFHMEREQHSEYEGDALPIFAGLPYSDQFWVVRIAYEPTLVAIGGILLHLVGLFDIPAMVFLIVSAVLLAVKNCLRWYQGWLQLRTLMDAKFAAPLVVKAATGKASERELAQVHLAGFPKNVPADIRVAAMAQMMPRTATLPPEIADLLSPLDTTERRAA